MQVGSTYHVLKRYQFIKMKPNCILLLKADKAFVLKMTFLISYAQRGIAREHNDLKGNCHNRSLY